MSFWLEYPFLLSICLPTLYSGLARQTDVDCTKFLRVAMCHDLLRKPAYVHFRLIHLKQKTPNLVLYMCLLQDTNCVFTTALHCIFKYHLQKQCTPHRVKKQ